MDKSKTARSLIRLGQKSRVLFPVHISYAHPDVSVTLTIHVKPGTTIQEAIGLSGIQKIVKEAKLIEGQVGIFGEIKSPDTPIQENDRIEIYRPLAATPEKNRKKAALQQTN